MPGVSRLFVVIMSLAGALFAAPQHAAARPESGVLLEAYAGERPGDANELLAPVIEELSSAGFTSPADASERIHRSLSTPGAPLSADQLAEVRRFIDSGYEQFVEGNFDLAVGDLSRGLDALMDAPGTLAGAPEHRELMLRGLIGVALSHKRQGRSVEATRAMAELLRTFPDKEISYQEYGPEPRKFYDQVKTDLAKEGLGSLRVTVDDPATVVFINERYVGVGDVTARDLLRGRYRVFVQQGERTCRVHRVNVEAGAETPLAITWELDAALRTESGPARLELPDEARRDRLAGPHAVHIARSLGAKQVATLGIQEVGGRRAIVGMLFGVDSSRPVRTGTVAIEPAQPSAEKLRKLGEFLAGDEEAARFLDPLPLPVVAAEKPARRSGRPLAAWKWITLAAGLSAVGAGITLVAIDQPGVNPDGSRNDVSRNTATAGYATAGVGAALTALSIYFFIRDAGDRAAADVAVVPIAGELGGVAVMGVF